MTTFNFEQLRGPILPDFRYYDQGWNARVKGQPFKSHSTKDWQDGWNDCDQAPEEHRKEVA